jgi:hypothetical protein
VLPGRLVPSVVRPVVRRVPIRIAVVLETVTWIIGTITLRGCCCRHRCYEAYPQECGSAEFRLAEANLTSTAPLEHYDVAIRRALGAPLDLISDVGEWICRRTQREISDAGNEVELKPTSGA